MASTVPDHARVLGIDEADERHQQHGGVEALAAQRLGEGAEALVVAFLEDLGLDAVAQRPPGVQRPLEAELLDPLDRAVEHHPGHGLRGREVLRRAPDLPDAAVRLVPDLLDMLDQRPLDVPGLRAEIEPVLAGGMEDVENLAEDVELELAVGAVADPDGSAALVAGEPVGDQLALQALARHPIHDRHLRGAPGGGAEEPLGPALGLLTVAREKERVERERRVAQPAIAIVPVALAADLLGQRHRRRRHRSRRYPGWSAPSA